MQEQTETKADEQIKGKGRQAKTDDSHLVEMTKADEQIKVHPSCVADHKRMGWVEA
ncbi:hypothetical protein [Thauera humireducens]|uniref:hypothetical protein n=1 Tax=Thauera humireducens TaxID=1134435 RepID=UPI00311F1014